MAELSASVDQHETLPRRGGAGTVPLWPMTDRAGALTPGTASTTTTRARAQA